MNVDSLRVTSQKLSIIIKKTNTVALPSHLLILLFIMLSFIDSSEENYKYKMFYSLTIYTDLADIYCLSFYQSSFNFS